MFQLEDVLKLTNEDLDNYSDRVKRAMQFIQRSYSEINERLDRINKEYKEEYRCSYCGCIIIFENRYLWHVCKSCRNIYQTERRDKITKKQRREFSSNYYNKMKTICDEDCEKCKYPDCIKPTA